MTKSEQRKLDELENSSIYKVLEITKDGAGRLVVVIDVINRAQGKPFTPPYKYRQLHINKWGKVLYYFGGNQWDDGLIDGTKIEVVKNHS